MDRQPRIPLYIFTSRFPFGTGESFLANELQVLAGYFDITLLPSRVLVGETAVSDAGYVCETGLSAYVAGKNPLRLYLAGMLFLCSSFPRLLKLIRPVNSFRGFRQTLRYLGLSWYARVWMKKYFEGKQCTQGILYTYWLSYITLALSCLKAHSGHILITRVHGFDLYEERGDSMPVALKQSALEKTDRIFPISIHGLEYLSRKFRIEPGKIRLSKLGVFEPGFLNAPSSDECIRIVSCAYLVEVKRIHLIPGALQYLVKNRPGFQFHWHHIGGGPLFAGLKELIEANPGLEEHCTFHGDLDNAGVFNIYRSIPFDVFINVSSSEGLPVSIMEAQAVGIPVIATAVGGTPEIVNPENGRLLTANPGAAEIAGALFEVHQQREKWLARRATSRLNWEVNFHAGHNFSRFANELIYLSAHE